MSSMDWTTGQRAAIDGIRQHLIEGRPERPYVLKGYAGTGKTTLVSEAICDMRAVLVLAPTHKAASVLRQKLPRVSGWMSIATIHKALGYTTILNEETGEERFVRGGSALFPQLAERQNAGERVAVIVDEISMVGGDLWAQLREELERHGLRAVLQGDPLQLPPVRETISPTFEAGDGVELTEVVRSGGCLTRAVLGVRQRIADRQAPVIREAAKDHEGQVCIYGTREAAQEAWLERLVAGEDIVVVGWTNEAIDHTNAVARATIVGANTDPFVPGEWLVLQQGHRVEWEEQTDWGTILIKSQMLHNGDRLLVLDAQVIVDDHGFECWQLKVRRPGSEALHVRALDASQRRMVEIVCKRMFDDADRYDVGDTRRRAILQHRLDIRRSYINARPQYACTVHKSQGSTWDQVVVLSDLLRNRKFRERNQLLYVAYSRASKGLHVRAA